MSEDSDLWPVVLSGVTEAVVSTQGPNDRWNVAALGLHAPEKGSVHPTARTWGETRTCRNFREDGVGYVQFIQDPVLYVDAALDIHETDEPVLDASHCWVEVHPEEIDRGKAGETEWTEWELVAESAEVTSRVVPTFNRGYAAVVEATVAASRLDVDAYDNDRLWDRICYYEDVADRCGGPRVKMAFKRVLDLVNAAERSCST